MKRILAVSLLALNVAGCGAGFPNPFTKVANPVSPTNLYEAQLVFDGSVKTFNELKSLCAAKALPPACRTYVNQGRSIIIQAYAADKAAEQFIAQNPTLDATNVVQAFTGLVSSFKGTVNSLSGVK